MKKSVSIFLSLFLLFSLCSCGGEKGEGASLSQTSALSETSVSAVSETSAVSTSFETVTVTKTTALSTEKPTAEKKAETTVSVTSQKAEEKTTAESTKPAQTVPASETEEEGITCFVEIDCRNAKKNLSSLKKGKESFVPKNGYVLKKTAVTLPEGSTAFDALKKACKENVCTDNCKYCQRGGIQLESSFTAAYQSYYVEGIHQLYEKDCGSLSGWMYNVDGVFPDVSSSVFALNGGETITFVYTASMGDDLG